MIRILHLITGIDIGGAETLLLSSLSRLQKEERYDISVCYLKGEGTLKSEFIMKGIKVIDLSNYIFLKKVLKLFFLLKTEKYSIVHTHLIQATLLGRIISRAAGIPVVIATEHNTSNFQKKYFLIMILYSLTQSLNQKIIAISNAVKKELIKKVKILEEKIEVLYNGIEIQTFTDYGKDPELLQKFKLQKIFPVIGTVGRLDFRKGQIFLIRAIAKLKGTYPDIKLIIVGGGELENELKEECKRLGITDIVFFLGTQKNIKNFLSILDIFILPSLQEGLSISLIEAMSMGKSVIATNIGGIPEVVSDKVDGLLVEPKNIDMIVEAVKFILNNAEQRDKMRENARIKVEKKFSIENYIYQLDNIYMQLLNASINN
jgi:glycosyltransferase involved in cell wall biosynthesis